MPPEMIGGMSACTSRNNGFTVLELLTALAVIAVLTVLAAPSFVDLLTRINVQSSLHTMSTSLALARIDAVTRGQPATLCPSTGGHACSGGTDWSSGWILYRDPNRKDQPQSPADIIEMVQPIHGSLAMHTSAGRQRIRFHPSGWAPGSNLRLRICSRASDKLLGSIIVSNAGRPRVEHHDATQSCSNDSSSQQGR